MKLAGGAMRVYSEEESEERNATANHSSQDVSEKVAKTRAYRKYCS